MSANLRKCICLQPVGSTFAGTPQDYRFEGRDGSVRAMFGELDTRWVRVWAVWPALQPQNVPIDDAAQNPGYEKLLNLDRLIRAINDDGRSVILCLWQFPWWANGTPDPQTISSAQAEHNKYKIPTNLNADGPWAGFVSHLYRRYNPAGPNNPSNARIQVMEIINEPNEQLWPQRDSNGSRYMHCAVASMFLTGIAVSEWYDHSMYLMGPALGDNEAPSSENYTNPLDFMADFNAMGIRVHSRFIWSHHNYRSTEVASNDSTRQVRSRLVERWTGYTEGGGPVVFATEGGARLAKFNGDRIAQRDALSRELNDNRSAPGIGMFTNYLVYDDEQGEGSNQYSGLRDSYNYVGAKRPAYNLWAGFPRGSDDLVGFKGAHDLGPGWITWDPAILSRRPGHLEIFAVNANDRAIYSTWTYDGSPWAPWHYMGGYCESAPTATSIAEGSMHVYVVGMGRNLYERFWTPGGGWSNWWNMGGYCVGDPGVASMNPGHIEVFAKSSDNQIWHRWWTVHAGWSGWHSLGGNAASGPAAASWSDGRMDVVYVGWDGAVWHNYFAGGVWHSWSSLGGSSNYHADICSWGSGRLDVFARNPSGRVQRKVFDNHRWGAWEPVHGTASDFGPGCVAWGGAPRIDIAWTRGGRVYTAWHH